MDTKNNASMSRFEREWTRIVQTMSTLVRKREVGPVSPAKASPPLVDSQEKPMPKFSSGVYAIVSAVSRHAFMYPKA
jgi:hypothetical protein